MKRDLRTDPQYQATFEFFRRQIEPLLGLASAALEAHIAPNGAQIAIAATVWTQLSGLPAQRIGLAPSTPATPLLHSADVSLLESDGDDVFPRWSPDGSALAFISDRRTRGHFELYLMNALTHTVTLHAYDLAESIESLAWSPDSTCLLLQTVGRGADRAGASGSGVAKNDASGEPDWLPDIEESVPDNLWRRLYVYRPAYEVLEPVGPRDLTFWEAAWCGDASIVAIASANPREGAWHRARCIRIDRADGESSTLYDPPYEIGVPVGTSDGRFAAAIVACCSDRTIVAGDAIVFDLQTPGAVHAIDTHGVDVTHLAPKDARTIVYAGIRGFETVVGEIDCVTGIATQTYTTRESFARRYPSVTVAPDGAYVTVVHSYARPPAVVRIASAVQTVLVDFAHDGYAAVRSNSTIEEVRWSGRDGLSIEGLLVQPNVPGPHPLLVKIHGGPVGAYTNAWQMNDRLAPLLAAHGYATLHPNPRGSSGRGQAFAHMVRGDMNGEDTFDIIAGAQALVARGIADPARLAVTGVSYGGMMSAWIVTQTDLFAAAIPVAPVTDMVSQHFSSNIPDFDAEFFKSDPTSTTGKHVTRSAIRYAKSVTTPTLTIAGALDRCTPAVQAIEFHRALIEAGVPSELVIYPLEGHGVREFEAFIDYCTRILAWLERYAGGTRANADRRTESVTA